MVLYAAWDEVRRVGVFAHYNRCVCVSLAGFEVCLYVFAKLSGICNVLGLGIDSGYLISCFVCFLPDCSYVCFILLISV